MLKDAKGKLSPQAANVLSRLWPLHKKVSDVVVLELLFRYSTKAAGESDRVCNCGQKHMSQCM